MAARFRRRGGLIERALGAELLLLDPASDAVHVLNSTSARVWAELAEPRSRDVLAGRLRQAFAGAAAADVEGDLHRLLAALGAAGLVEEVGD